MDNSFVIKGDICYSLELGRLWTREDAYLVCEAGVSRGVFDALPEAYRGLPLHDYSGRLVIPGLTDLHVHAPQCGYRALDLDMELLEWLEARTFPEESRFADLDYAEQIYAPFVEDLRRGPNTRACVFATVHVPATLRLMDMLEASGLVTMVGKVNMDRNSPDTLREQGAAQSIAATREWLAAAKSRFARTMPILTPRFIPSCTDELMRSLGALQRESGVPVQSHLSENLSECEWVRELCPWADFYGDAYDRFGLFGRETPTVMAHCVWSSEAEIERMLANGVYVAHCPQSNTNVASGIAPVRRYLTRGLRVGLGSDVAGGSHTSIFRAMSDAIQVSKLHWRLQNTDESPLTVPEAFHLATVGGGSFFGRVGSFAPGYELDAVVIDDAALRSPCVHTVEDRLSRVVYLSDDRHIEQKYVRGTCVL